MFILIRLEVLDNVGMVNFLQHIDLVHHMLQILLRHLVLVQNLDGDFKFWILLIGGPVDFSECALAKHLRLNFILRLQLGQVGVNFDLGCLFVVFHHNVVLLMRSNRRKSVTFLLLGSLAATAHNSARFSRLNKKIFKSNLT